MDIRQLRSCVHRQISEFFACRPEAVHLTADCRAYIRSLEEEFHTQLLKAHHQIALLTCRDKIIFLCHGDSDPAAESNRGTANETKPQLRSAHPPFRPFIFCRNF